MATSGLNLGVVELTIALHRVFDSPNDRLVWDTGHQAYVHKILTGRAEDFPTLKKHGGLSGYPSRSESPHDVVENSHASTALSWADGLAKAYQVSGDLGRRSVVAVIGDGALTGGMAWEALNTIAAAKDRPMVIVVNDNERSYAPTIGGMANHLATLRTTGVRTIPQAGVAGLGRTPVVGAPLDGTLHGMKKGLKDMVAPQGLFEDLGLKYIGPVDGHDVVAVEHALRRARELPGPVLVHVLTYKGLGDATAENDVTDQFHGVGIIDPETGLPIRSRARVGRRSSPTRRFRSAPSVRTSLESPRRCSSRSDLTVCPGLPLPRVRRGDRGAARGDVGGGDGARGPASVVAVYATFLNRAFDQVLMDRALHHAGVTFVLDRAGVTGDDGPSHNGMWDMSILQVVPGLRLAAPRDAPTLREEFREALTVDDAPTVVRFPKGALRSRCRPLPGARRGRLAAHGEEDVLVVAVGAMASLCVEVAAGLAAQGIGVTAVDPRRAKPLPDSLPQGLPVTGWSSSSRTTVASVAWAPP